MTATTEPIAWQPSPVVERATAQIHRAAASLAPNWAESAAMLIVNTGEVAAGLAALPVLEQLRRRHVRRPWGDRSTTVVCDACQTAWPCPDASILGIV